MSRILIKSIGLNLTNRFLICRSYSGTKTASATSAATINNNNNNRIIYNNHNKNFVSNNKNFDDNNKASPDQLHQLEQKLVPHLPKFFTAPHLLSLYTRDVVFIDNIRGFRCQGTAAYAVQVALIKFYHHVRYSSIRVELLNLVKNPEESYIRIRWRVIARPGLIKLVLSFWKFRAEEIWKDGISTMHVNKDGLIHCHVCDNIDVETDDGGAKGKLDKTIKNPLVSRGLNV